MTIQERVATKRRTSRPLGALLVNKGVFDNLQLAKALDLQRKREKKTHVLSGNIFIEMGFATEYDVAEALSNQYSFPYIPLNRYEFDRDILGMIPANFAKNNLVIPIYRIAHTLTVAMANPLDVTTIESLENMTDCNVQIFIATGSEINAAINKCYFCEEQHVTDTKTYTSTNGTKSPKTLSKPI